MIHRIDNKTKNCTKMTGTHAKLGEFRILAAPCKYYVKYLKTPSEMNETPTFANLVEKVACVIDATYRLYTLYLQVNFRLRCRLKKIITLILGIH